MTTETKAVDCRVMVVDDDDRIRDIIAEGIRKESGRVTAFEDAESAENEFAPGRYDVMVVDYNLPGMSGVDFIRKVREVDVRVGIVIVSAHMEKLEAGRLCDGLGVYSVVEKPFTMRLLKDKVRMACELSRIPPGKEKRLVDAFEVETDRLREATRNLALSLRERRNATA